MFQPRTEGQGPFAGAGGSRDRILFLKIKPVCVKILALSRPGASSSPELASTLAELRALLSAQIQKTPLPDPLYGCVAEVAQDEPSFGASVLHYAFFPLSQLFTSTPRGPSDLPDRTRQEAFSCLHLLVEQWWKEWAVIGNAAVPPNKSQERVQMWRQLLILASITLSGPPSKAGSARKPTNSQETCETIIQLLHALLVPRRTTERPAKPKQPAVAADWEWDGESELPDLHEVEGTPPKVECSVAPTLVYPSEGHLRMVRDSTFKSPLMHALTCAMDSAVNAPSHSSTVKLRSTAIDIVRAIATCWLPSEQLKGIMPGAVSSMIRVLTSSPEGTSTVRQSSKLVSGPVAARAIMLLREVAVPVLSDKATEGFRTTTATQSESSETLDDVVVAAMSSLNTYDGGERPPAHPAHEAKEDVASTALKTTVKNLTLALLTLDGRQNPAEPSLWDHAQPIVSEENESITAHSHPQAQQAAIYLASDILQNCRTTLIWYEETQKEAGQFQDGPELTILLTRWLLDLASAGGVSQTTADLALQNLRELSLTDRLRSPWIATLSAELAENLDRLPGAISGRRGANASRLAGRATTILSLALSPDWNEEHLVRCLQEFLGAQKDIERWGAKLISALEWSSESPSFGVESKGTESHYIYPTPSFAHLSPDEARKVAALLHELGRVSGRLILARAHQEAKTKDGAKDRKGKQKQSAVATSAMSFFFGQARQLRQVLMAQRRNRRGSVQAATSALAASTTALFIGREILSGLVSILDDAKLSTETGKPGRRARKQAHRIAEDILEDIADFWQDDSRALTDIVAYRPYDDDVGKVDPEHQQQESQALIGLHDPQATDVEHVKGLSAVAESAPRPSGLGPALNLAFVSASTIASSSPASTSKESNLKTLKSLASAHAQYQRSLELQVVALASVLLGPAFRGHMLSALYPTIAALNHSSQLISTTASRCLSTMAYASGYADMLTCVHENIDYILGEASWRLVAGLGKELEATTATERYRQLHIQASEKLGEQNTDGNAWLVALPSSSAASSWPMPLLSARTPPLVLTGVMQLLGPTSLHLIEDSVDEILDALDRFHGYDEVCDGLLGVLDKLLEVMRSDAFAGRAGQGESSSPKSSRQHRNRLPEPEEELDELERWLLNRHDGESASQGPADLQSAFDSFEEKHGSQAGEDEAVSPTAPPSAADRSQKLLVDILSKSLPFLSHGSPVIRARVLKLLGAGVELLAPPEGDAPPAESTSKAGKTWTRREDHILPIVNRAWPLILARLGWDVTRPLPRGTQAQRIASKDLTEGSPSVYFAALDLLRLLALHVPDFVGKRVTDEAWPRVRMLLELEEREASRESLFGAAGRIERAAPRTHLLRESESGSGSGSDKGRPDVAVTVQPAVVGGGGAGGEHAPSAALSTPTPRRTPRSRFRPLDAASPLAQLLLRTARALSPLMQRQGPAFPDKTLWDVLTFAPLLRALDARQDPALRAAVVELLRVSVHACDGGGTAWAAMRLLAGGGAAGGDAEAGANGDGDGEVGGRDDHTVEQQSRPAGSSAQSTSYWTFLSGGQGNVGSDLDVSLSCAEVFVAS